MSTATPAGSVPGHDDLLSLLEGTIEPVEKPPLYTVGLFLVAVVMVLLPVIYVGLIAGAGYLTYLHAVESVGILGGSGTRWRLLAYVTPLVAGIAVCFFMIKPLFARPPQGPQQVSVDAEGEPLLFAWVDRLRRLVGAPMPVRIDVDCDANASASFRRGLRSMFGRDLVLTIGLPLVAGMTLRQFTGVLAHELGHFAQGGGMSLSHLIRSINFWFGRVVYERDGFDEALDGLTRSGVIGLIAVGGVAKACVWLTRRILWALMHFGHLVSCFLLRQMEFDADRYETRVAGSDEFAGVMERLHELIVGQNVGQNNLGYLWSEKKLPDDLVGYCLAQIDKLDAESLQKYLEHTAAGRTRWFDTHPANSDRVAAARRENAPGLIRTDAKATVLFAHLDAASTRASMAFYTAVLGPQVDDRNLVPTTELIDGQEREASRGVGIGRFFQGAAGDDRAYFPEFVVGTAEAGLDPIRTELVAVRDQLVAAGEAESADRMVLANRRLRLAMQLLHLEDVSEKLAGDRDPVEFAARLLKTLDCLRRVREPAEQLGAVLQALYGNLRELEKNRNDKWEQREANDNLAKLLPVYDEIRVKMETAPYPFDHPDGEISCAVFAAPGDVDERDPDSVIHGSQQLLDRHHMLYGKCLSRLIELAENAESAAGLELLPEPPRSEAEEPALRSTSPD